MKTVDWNETTSCAEIVEQAAQEDVVLVRNGHAVALVIPFDDDDLEWYAREHDPAFLESIARARGQVENQRTVSHQELKRELGID